MLIKRLTLENFRPFINEQTIEFACEDYKNITIVMGENGAGKTTLSQAFLWVLYGDTEFKKKKDMLNRIVRDNLIVGKSAQVKVSLYVDYNGDDYTIVRSQKVHKTYSGFKIEDALLKIFKRENGQNTPLDKDPSIMIRKMLPQALSRFFFFDGERIKTMSEEIEKGKSKEFANAVEGLVGLTALKSALEHMKPTQSNNSVIGRYNKKIDNQGNEKIRLIGGQIEKIEKKINSIRKRLEEIEPKIPEYHKFVAETNAEIKEFATAEEVKRKFEKLQSEIIRLQATHNDAISAFLKFFNGPATVSFFAKPIINKSINDIPDNVREKKVPFNLHQKTLQELLDQKTCICGTKLIPGTPEFNEVYALFDILPPKSIGAYITEYKKESEAKLRQSTVYFSTMKNMFRRIRELNQNISEKQREMDNIESNLEDTGKVSELRKRRNEFSETVKRLEKEHNNLLLEIGGLESQKKQKESTRLDLINIDKQNNQFNIYLQYAYELYERLSGNYSEKEKSTRLKLQEHINEIFEEIYEGGISILVDPKYNLTVKIDDDRLLDEELESNTAQSFSVIFAFIAGIIRMAKEKGNEKSGEDNVFEEAEGYPLVMDAPLSSFDKKRIKNICETLPNIAQQAIMFIKDTDGEVAETHLSNRLGKKYKINKKSRIESYIIAKEGE